MLPWIVYICPVTGSPSFDRSAVSVANTSEEELYKDLSWEYFKTAIWGAVEDNTSYETTYPLAYPMTVPLSSFTSCLISSPGTTDNGLDAKFWRYNDFVEENVLQ